MGKVGVWGLLVVGLVAAAALGAGWWWTRGAGDPLAEARAAYDRGDWYEAASRARAALKERPDDLDSRRLLARATARLGRDDAAQQMYGRIGDRAMQAEDYFLVGAGLVRQGQSETALAVLDRAQKADPSHAEALHELARLNASLRRLDNAIAAAGRLAALPGWEVRGNLVLGMLREEDADPAGAAEAILRALKLDPALRGASAPPASARKLLARALLQTGRPAEARAQLAAVLAEGADPEASWLLSRAFLQEGAHDKASEALANAGDFGKDDPTRPEPAPYVGSKACAECHRSLYRAEQSSRHARTLYHPHDLKDFPLPAGPIPDPAVPGITHAFHRKGETIELETRAQEKTMRALVEYALGSGDRGLTMVGRDAEGMPRSFRVSTFADRKKWDLTPNAPLPDPADPESPLGRPLPGEALVKCLDCHMTSLHAARDPRAPEAADRGIGCERCHGPGAHHLAAVAAGFPDLAIIRPSLASGPQLVHLCAACHNSDDPTIGPTDPRAIRFQTSTMTQSRCYTATGGGLSCVTCHDPHRDAATESASYERQCLACHAAEAPKPSQQTRHAVLAEGQRRVPCPVNASSGCINCHMPSTEGAVPHTSFTDHNIRVHKKGDVGG